VNEWRHRLFRGQKDSPATASQRGEGERTASRRRGGRGSGERHGAFRPEERRLKNPAAWLIDPQAITPYGVAPSAPGTYTKNPASSLAGSSLGLQPFALPRGERYREFRLRNSRTICGFRARICGRFRKRSTARRVSSSSSTATRTKLAII